MSLTVTPADEVLAELLATPEGQRDPYPRYRRLHELDPFHRSLLDGLWYACRYEDCRAVLLDPRFGKERRRVITRHGVKEEVARRFGQRQRHSMLLANPPEHTRLRTLVSRVFNPRRVEALAPRVAELTDERLEAIARQGEADLMAELAFPLPVAVVSELVGVPHGDRDRFRQLVPAIMAADAPYASDRALERADLAGQELEAYFVTAIGQRRAAPRDDLLSDLVAARDEDDGRLSEEELVATAILLFVAGFVTTTNLIGNGLLALLRHPTELERLRREPALVADAVEEMLRYDSPVQLNLRTALEPVDVAGCTVAAGESVLTLIGAANRDPGRFPDPDRFDVGRRGDVSLSFGAGIHHCLGAALARLEGRVVFSRLLERFASITPLDAEPNWSSGLTLRGLRTFPVAVGPR